MKDLRTELYQMLYEQPIYPKNLYLDREPMKHAEYREKVIQRQIALLHERDVWKRPGPTAWGGGHGKIGGDAFRPTSSPDDSGFGARLRANQGSHSAVTP